MLVEECAVACVYVVVALEACEPHTLMPLGVFDCESRAQAFVDQVPPAHRFCVGIQRWWINQPTSDPLWRGSALKPRQRVSTTLNEGAPGTALALDPAYRRFRAKILHAPGGGGVALLEDG